MEPPAPSEASFRLRDLQNAWWKEMQERHYGIASMLSDQIVVAAISLRRATYIEIDRADIKTESK